MTTLNKSNSSLNNIINNYPDSIKEIDETKNKMKTSYENYLKKIDYIDKTNMSILTRNNKVLIRKR